MSGNFKIKEVSKWKFKASEIQPWEFHIKEISPWHFKIKDFHVSDIDVTSPIVLSVIMTDSVTCVITFNETLKIVTPSLMDYVFDNHDISNVAISGKTIIITISTPVLFGESASVSYISGNLSDISGNLVTSFTEDVSIELYPNGSVVNLQASSDEDNVTLTWDNGSTDETSISIERSIDGIIFSEIDSIESGIEIYNDNGLDDDVYYYRVRAKKNNYYSDYSNVVEIEVSSTPVYEDETITFLSKLSIAQNEAQKTAINNVFIALKSSGALAKLDQLIVPLNNNTDSLKSWCSNRVAIAVNNPVFTSNYGWEFIGTNYIRSSVIPGVDSVNFQLSAASFGILFNTTTDTAPNKYEIHGSWASGALHRVQLTRPQPASLDYSVFLNDSTYTSLPSTERFLNEWLTGIRTGNNKKLYRHKTLKIDATVAPTQLNLRDIFIGSTNNNNTAFYHEIDNVGAFFIGGDLTQTQYFSIIDAISAFKTSYIP